MFDYFTLKIELGGDAMQSGPDVAAALRDVADKIEHGLEARGSIVDVNGNTVGTYGPHNDEDPDDDRADYFDRRRRAGPGERRPRRVRVGRARDPGRLMLDWLILILGVMFALAVVGGTLYGIGLGCYLLVEAIRNHRRENR
jgi:hypothetical protein